MNFNDLFENRVLVANKLKDYIREKGYTKVSFSNKTGISRPTLDKLLSGTVDNKISFDRHMNKILHVFNLTIDDLFFYTPDIKKQDIILYSRNNPENHKMDQLASEEYALLLDIIDMCSIYYE